MTLFCEWYRNLVLRIGAKSRKLCLEG